MYCSKANVLGHQSDTTFINGSSSQLTFAWNACNLNCIQFPQSQRLMNWEKVSSLTLSCDQMCFRLKLELHLTNLVPRSDFRLREIIRLIEENPLNSCNVILCVIVAGPGGSRTCWIALQSLSRTSGHQRGTAMTNGELRWCWWWWVPVSAWISW